MVGELTRFVDGVIEALIMLPLLLVQFLWFVLRLAFYAAVALLLALLARKVYRGVTSRWPGLAISVSKEGPSTPPVAPK
jgi:hypothetical protein